MWFDWWFRGVVEKRDEFARWRAFGMLLASKADACERGWKSIDHRGAEWCVQLAPAEIRRHLTWIQTGKK